MWSAQRAGTPRGTLSANSETGMQRFRTQGSTTAVPARRLSSPATGPKAFSSSALMPTVTPAASSSSPAPRRMGSPGVPLVGRGLQPSPSRRPPAPNGGRQAQQDLTQKLRAMDLALERIESEDFMKKHHHSHGEEDLDPPTANEGWEAALHSAAISLDVAGHKSNSCGRLPSPLRTCSAPPDEPPGSRSQSHDSRQPKAEAKSVDPHRFDDLEARWNEAHAALRAELTQGLESLREGREEQHNNTVRLLTEFEVELTAALEARMKEADSIMEKRLIEAGEGMQRRMTDFEACAAEERATLAVFEGKSTSRLDEMEATIRMDRTRATEQSEALESAKEQLIAFRQRIHQLQEECNDSKENLATCRQRIQQVQEYKEDVKEQLTSLRQRISGLDSFASNPSASEVELRRTFTEMDSRLQRFEDGLTARFQESEGRIRSSASEEIAGLRQRIQPLLDAAATGASSGSNNCGLTAEAERRLQRLDESCSARICESEGRLLAQQRALEGQNHDSRHELQRNIGDLEHRLLSELRLLEARSTGGRLEERFDDFQRSCEVELTALRERLDGFELRCVEEAREVFRNDIDESEARSLGTIEASVSAQFEALRSELRAEVLPRCRHDKDPFADAMQHQLAQSQEERRVLSGQLETLADRQKRQQHLIEDLLSAAARRPSALGDGSQSGSAAVPLLPSAPTQAAFEAISTRLASVENRIIDQAPSSSEGLVGRVAAVEDRLTSIGSRRPNCEAGHSHSLCRGEVGSASIATAAAELAERCSGRLDLLSARVASVEDRVAASTAPPAASVAEVQEALRAWPPKLEELASRLDNDTSDLRRDLAKELEAGLERVQVEGGQQRAEVEAFMSRTVESLTAERKVQAEEFATQVSKTSNAEQTAAVAESMAAIAVEQARGVREVAEKAEQSYCKSIATLELDRAKSQARSESESREFAAMARLEARLEGAEARQIFAFTELSERLEEELKRDANRSNRSLSIENTAADVDLRRSPAYRCNGFASTDEQAPWFKALRNLECHLKALLAAQAEDSAEALRSMAQMVEEHSVLRGDVTSYRGDVTMMRHSGYMDDTIMSQQCDSSLMRTLCDR